MMNQRATRRCLSSVLQAVAGLRAAATLVGLAPALGAFPALAAEAPDTQPAAVALDAELQQAIDRVVHAAGDAERALALDALRARAEAAPLTVIQQLVLRTGQAADPRDALASGAILDELTFSQSALVAAVVPLLDGRDQTQVAAARGILAAVEDASAERAPDFSYYRELIAARVAAGQAPPAGLIRHMYELAPGHALLAMLRAYQLRHPDEIKPILWAEHAVSDVIWKQRYGFLAPGEIEPQAAVELARMARHDHWWARLYAVQIMRQHAEFRLAELVAALQADDDPLVRDAAQSLGAP